MDSMEAWRDCTQNQFRSPFGHIFLDHYIVFRLSVSSLSSVVVVSLLLKLLLLSSLLLLLSSLLLLSLSLSSLFSLVSSSLLHSFVCLLIYEFGLIVVSENNNEIFASHTKEEASKLLPNINWQTLDYWIGCFMLLFLNVTHNAWSVVLYQRWNNGHDNLILQHNNNVLSFRGSILFEYQITLAITIRV